MRYLLASLLLLIGSNIFAAEKSTSVTMKPSSGIAGTVSFNIHPDQSVTVLIYESVSKISETTLSIDSKAAAEMSELSELVLDEFISLKGYSQLPEYKQTSAIAITQDKVTKSISTRRYSEQLISLIKMIKGHLPERHQPQLEKE